MGARGDFGPHWLGITWSLAVEEQFYLFIPILIYLLPRRVLVCALVLAILAAPFLRYTVPATQALVSTPLRSDSLLSGALLAVLVRWHPFVSYVRQHRKVLLALFIALLAGAAVLTSHTAFFGVFNHLWLAGLYSTLILIAFLGSEPFLGRILGSAVLGWFGQLSYGIYMFHEAVNGLLHGSLRQSAPEIRTLSDAGVTLMALCLTLALAALAYRYFESPILRFGHGCQYLPKAR